MTSLTDQSADKYDDIIDRPDKQSLLTFTRSGPRALHGLEFDYCVIEVLLEYDKR